MKTNLLFIGIIAVITIAAIAFYHDKYSIIEIGAGIASISGILYGYIKGNQLDEVRGEKEQIEEAFKNETGITYKNYKIR